MDWNPHDHLWKSIQRYDAYYGATNNKGALLIAYFTFSLGVVLVQLGNIDLIAPVTDVTARRIFLCLCALVTLATVAALVQVLRVVSPYLLSNKKPGLYHSIIYYADVAEHESADSFVEQIGRGDAQKMTEDLARQAHVLAQGLRTKYRLMKIAFRFTLFAQLPLLASLVIFVAVRRF